MRMVRTRVPGQVLLPPPLLRRLRVPGPLLTATTAEQIRLRTDRADGFAADPSAALMGLDTLEACEPAAVAEHAGPGRASAPPQRPRTRRRGLRRTARGTRRPAFPGTAGALSAMGRGPSQAMRSRMARAGPIRRLARPPRWAEWSMSRAVRPCASPRCGRWDTSREAGSRPPKDPRLPDPAIVRRVRRATERPPRHRGLRRNRRRCPGRPVPCAAASAGPSPGAHGPGAGGGTRVGTRRAPGTVRSSIRVTSGQRY